MDWNLYAMLKKYVRNVALGQGAVEGPRGLQGPKGDPGPEGPQGPQGQKGDPGGIEDAPADGTLYGRRNGAWEPIFLEHDLLFFINENNIPTIGHIAPTSPQIVMPKAYFPATAGDWYDIVTFAISSNMSGSEMEFKPGKSFGIRLWITSDIERDNAQMRIRAVDRQTGTLLTSATVAVDLGTTGVSTPVVFNGLYEMPAIVNAEDVKVTLSVLSPLYGVQFGIMTNPPDEISYISRLL